MADGGSLDETAATATRAGATVISAPPGRAAQQNAGARVADGDVLLFLHADSALDIDCLAQIERSRMRRPFGAFKQRIDDPGRVYRLIERGNAWRAASRGLPYGDQAIFIDRDFFFALGQFPDVPIMEDYLLMKKARSHQRPVVLEGPVTISARRWQRNGVLRQTLRNWSMVLAAMAGASPQRLASSIRVTTWRKVTPPGAVTAGLQTRRQASAVAVQLRGGACRMLGADADGACWTSSPTS